MTKAQRKAFKKMRAGLARYRAGRGRARVVVTNPRRKRRRRNGLAMVNPRRRRRTRARIRVTNPGGKHMARRRRRRSVAVTVNPRRRRRHLRRRNPGRRMVAHRRRRRNPEGGILSILINATLAGGAAGAAIALVDGKILAKQSMVVKVLAKVGLAAATGFLFGRRHPNFARSMIAGITSTIGFEGVMAMQGGVVAADLPAAAAQMKSLIREDPRAMGVLVQARRRQLSGMGAYVDENVSLSGPLEANALPGATFQDVRIR